MKPLQIDPGALRTRLALERRTMTTDGAGGHAESWSVADHLFAEVTPVTARSRFGAGQRLEMATHVVTLRQRGDVEAGMRFRLGARVLDIATVFDPDETGRYIACATREVRP